MSLFSGRAKIVLGVVHLAALPAAPHFAGDRGEIRQRALSDVRSYVAGGIDGIIIENYGDTPFHGGRVEPSVVAEMTRIVTEARQLTGNDTLLGVNILRNDASAAIAVAAAAGADFVRVNVHTGAMLCDQGWIEGQAPQTLRFRRAIGSDIAIAADVAVKHALTPEGFDLVTAAQDCAGRGGADALIITGKSTGSEIDAKDLQTVRAALPETPLLAGSGVTAENVARFLAHADGCIVGTSLKKGGRVEEAVDEDRVRALMNAVR